MFAPQTLSLWYKFTCGFRWKQTLEIWVRNKNKYVLKKTFIYKYTCIHVKKKTFGFVNDLQFFFPISWLWFQCIHIYKKVEIQRFDILHVRFRAQPKIGMPKTQITIYELKCVCIYICVYIFIPIVRLNFIFKYTYMHIYTFITCATKTYV